MKQEVIDKLVEVGLFDKTSISEEEYNKHNKVDGDILYSKSEYKWDDGNVQKFFWQTDTKGLTSEEIDLLLKIDQTKNIRTIKNVEIFFAALTAISLVISIISAVSVANMF